MSVAEIALMAAVMPWIAILIAAACVFLYAIWKYS
jgi:hypothetical protein